MCEHSVDELAGHLGGALRQVVERGDCREDDGTCVGCELHVAKMDAIEGRFADAEDERTAFFETDVGCPMDEIGGETVGDGSERSHGAGKDDHAVGGIAAAGDVGGDIVFGVVLQLGARRAEEFLR